MFGHLQYRPTRDRSQQISTSFSIPIQSALHNIKEETEEVVHIRGDKANEKMKMYHIEQGLMKDTKFSNKIAQNNFINDYQLFILRSVVLKFVY